MTAERLRIAIDGRSAPGSLPTTCSLAHNVLKTIQAADPANEYFAYFGPHAGGAAKEYGGVRCISGGPRQSVAWTNMWLLHRLRSDRIDAYVTTSPRGVPLAPTRARIALLVEDASIDELPKISVANLAKAVGLRSAAMRADAVLAVSAFAKDQLVSRLKLNERKVRPISMGLEIDHPIAPERIASVLQRHRLERPYALAIGGTEPRRNNARVLQAMGLLGDAHSNLTLAVAGPAWRGQQFASGLVTSRTTLLGQVSEDDLPALMAAAEMLVFPSIGDARGLPVLQAMALGVPVVTAASGAVPEVAGDAALYADPDNASEIAAQIRKVLTDPELVSLLCTKGRERAERFRWTETCTTIATVCEGLMEKRTWRTQPATH